MDFGCAWEGGMIVCPPPPPQHLAPDAILGVGFGIVTVSRDGERVWSGDSWTKRVKSLDRLVRKVPDADWRIEFYGPLITTIYQRQGQDWVLVERKAGFA